MRIAFDPGGTTGIAVRFDDGTIYTVHTQEQKEVYDLANRKYDVVILEDFVAVNIDNYMRHTIRLVGAITGITHINNNLLAVQTPQTRKGFIYKAKQILGPKPAPSIHEVDAFAHLLAWEAINHER